ncbi:MAG: cellulase family glycosylhydrolase [Ignavibacteriae bacterium]|nr:cellulase family glycosylhydrolase [Ignavibacteriota bacterium]
MKKFLILYIVVVSQIFAQTPFTKGINLTGWFQEEKATLIHFGKYTKQDFRNIKSLGCDVIRLPINLHFMTDGAPNYYLDPIFVQFLDSVVTWAEEININLILDNHSFDPAVSTNPNVGEVLIPVWQQMAEHYKNRSKLIFYEILNEPNGISRTIWNSTQQNVINAIREIDSVHTIIVGGTSWNSYNELNYLPQYSDTNLIYTFHFYDPFLFTHQGASWTSPSMVGLANVPFPYSAAEMPVMPTSFDGTWVETSYNSYKTDGTEAKVKSLIDIAANFQKNRNVPVFCGEFGVFISNADTNERVEWYRIVREYLEGKDITWTSWDYQNGFGLFEKGTDELFNYDLNIPLIKALGFNEVVQEDLVIQPDSNGFDFYKDKIGGNITPYFYHTTGELNYYVDSDSREGKFSFYWANANQYEFINFNFVPNKDLSYLAQNNYYLHISVKGNSPGGKFDLRFIDTKTDDKNDHPWRRRYTVTESNSGPWNNTWHDLAIPFSNFVEHGSWDNNQWYNPIGAFDWSQVDNFDIVAEDANLLGKEFWFDNIYISDNPVGIKENKIYSEFSLSQNYPNPFNPITTIKYSIPKNVKNEIPNVHLIIYDILGSEVKTLVNEKQIPGNYEIQFDGNKLSSGVYFYKIQAGTFSDIKKMMLIK